MLVSMTGFGESRFQGPKWTVSVEIRTVNNRHFKLNSRISEPYGQLEPEIERLIRETIRRGSVQLNIRVERLQRSEDFQLNLTALKSYRDQLRTLQNDPACELDLATLALLPGVVRENLAPREDPHDDWPELEKLITQAIDKLQASRRREGQAMAEDLTRLAEAALSRLADVEARTPVVVEQYRDRLYERVQNLIQGSSVSLDPKDLIREVAIFAERGDITEETTRLKAHLKEFLEMLNRKGASGRTLEFLLQEMGRESNTLGAKSNDVEISRHTVEIKGLLESIRELILNVE